MSKKRDTWTAARYAAVEAAAKNSKPIPDRGPAGAVDPHKPQPVAAAPDHSASVAAHVQTAHAEAIKAVPAATPPAPGAARHDHQAAIRKFVAVHHAEAMKVVEQSAFFPKGAQK